MTDDEQFHVSKSLHWYAFKSAVEDIIYQGIIPEDDKEVIMSQAGDYRKITNNRGEVCGVYIAVDNDVTLNLLMSACKPKYRDRMWPVIANKLKHTAQSRKLIAMATTFEDDDDAIRVLSKLQFQPTAMRVDTYLGRNGTACDHVIKWFWDEYLQSM